MSKTGLVLEGGGFIIRPSRQMDIGRLESDVEKVQAAYELGRADALASLDELKNWLEKGE